VLCCVVLVGWCEQKGIPYDDKERWRVFHDPLKIDTASLPEPVIPEEEGAEESKEGEKKGMGGLLGGLF
jgi:hypothetical protein